MPQGIQVWDESGNLIFDQGSSLGVLCGSATTTDTPGESISVSLPPGKFFYIPVLPNGSMGYIPDITYSNGRITWSLGRDTDGNHIGTIRPIMFYYGVR